MAAIIKFLFVFLAIFALASALQASKEETKTLEDTKTVEASSTLNKPAVEAHGHEGHAAADKQEEQTRQKRSCKTIGFTSRSGRKLEAGHGC